MASDWTPAASARRWLSTSDDVVATDADGRVALWSADALPLCHPRDWPAAFRSCAPLKELVNKKGLRGTRCRSCAILPPPAAAAAVELLAFHPFSNSEAVHAALGWPVVKGSPCRARRPRRRRVVRRAQVVVERGHGHRLVGRPDAGAVAGRRAAAARRVATRREEEQTLSAAQRDLRSRSCAACARQRRPGARAGRVVADVAGRVGAVAGHSDRVRGSGVAGRRSTAGARRRRLLEVGQPRRVRRRGGAAADADAAAERCRCRLPPPPEAAAAGRRRQPHDGRSKRRWRRRRRRRRAATRRC